METAGTYKNKPVAKTSVARKLMDILTQRKGVPIDCGIDGLTYYIPSTETDGSTLTHYFNNGNRLEYMAIKTIPHDENHEFAATITRTWTNDRREGTEYDWTLMKINSPGSRTNQDRWELKSQNGNSILEWTMEVQRSEWNKFWITLICQKTPNGPFKVIRVTNPMGSAFKLPSANPMEVSGHALTFTTVTFPFNSAEYSGGIEISGVTETLTHLSATRVVE